MAERFDIHEEVLDDFLLEVEEEYGNHPFHNSVRAADVLHSVVYLLHHTSCKDMPFTDTDVVALLLSSIVIHFKHPGFSNNFLVQSGHTLALEYNDVATVENYHLSSAFRVLKKFNIFQRIPDCARKRIRKIVIQLVLSTDPADTYELIDTWVSKVRQEDVNLEEDEDRMALMQMILKLSTVAWVFHERELCDEWNKRLCEERFNQGDIEKSMGLRVSPFSARNETTPEQQLHAYINWLARPTFLALSEFVEFDDDVWKGNVEKHFCDL